MFLLRRTAARAFTAPSSLVPKPRPASTVPLSFRSQKPWILPSCQRRFANDATTANEAGAGASNPEAEAKAEASATEPSSIPPASTSVPANNQTVQDALRPASEAPARNGTMEATQPAGPAGFKRFALGPVVSPTTLYVGNLFFEVTAQQLEDQFSTVGRVVSARIVYDYKGLSRGYGYIEFEKPEDAQQAVEVLNQQPFMGRNMAVQFHRRRQVPDNSVPRDPHPPTRTLFIGNMSFEMTDKDLNDLFRQVRNVIDVRVAIDRRTGQPRGFAHADFIDVASAEIAYNQLKDKVIYGRRLRIDFSPNSRNVETVTDPSSQNTN